MTSRLPYTLAAFCIAILPALSQAPGLANINTQLRAQETKDSQLMWWLHEVTDVYGPRLTGSPGLRTAQDFAVGQMVKWGFSNVHLEAWNFNHPGLAELGSGSQCGFAVSATAERAGGLLDARAPTARCRVRCWWSNRPNPRLGRGAARGAVAAEPAGVADAAAA